MSILIADSSSLRDEIFDLSSRYLYILSTNTAIVLALISKILIRFFNASKYRSVCLAKAQNSVSSRSERNC